MRLDYNIKDVIITIKLKIYESLLLPMIFS